MFIFKKEKRKGKERRKDSSQYAEKVKALCIIGRNAKSNSHYEKHYGDYAKKLKVELLYNPAILLLYISPKDSVLCLLLKTETKWQVVSVG